VSDLAELLDRTVDRLHAYVSWPSLEAADAVGLWTACTHVAECFDTTPRLSLLSVEKRSGKSRVLEVLGSLVARHEPVITPSAAALYRLVADNMPTLLIDEADTCLGRKVAEAHEDLRAIVNAGWRKGMTIPRCVGPKHSVVRFPTFCPVALAGIGDLPDTILDRSVIVRMRRRAQAEHVEPFTLAEAVPPLAALGEELGKWGASRRTRRELARNRPAFPLGVTDRAADVWWPLLVIADAAGGHWPADARRAATRLVAEAAAAEDEGSLGVALLDGCRRLYRTKPWGWEGGVVSSSELVSSLVDDDEGPFSSDRRDKTHLDARKLAWRLRPYDIRPRTVRVGGATFKGYAWAEFADAWDRYLPPLREAEPAVGHPECLDLTGGGAPR